MKPTARLFSVLVLAFLIAPIFLLQGCGDNKNIPDGATITISPETVDLNNPGETVINLKVIARYADGSPIPYANLVISGAFAIPALTSLYQFYWFPGGNLVANNVPVDNENFKPQTDEFGVYDFSIVVFGTAFTDDISATSGTAVGKTTITLTTT